MKTCSTCKHWQVSTKTDRKYGTCERVSKKLVAICEGCVQVSARVDDLEYETEHNFGCTLHQTINPC
jgi:hypothetical protein